MEETSIEEKELLSVITAAVATMLKQSTETFCIRSITPVQKQESNWQKAGRMAQMQSRLGARFL